MRVKILSLKGNVMAKTPIILDTDPGVDDAAAIGLALASDTTDIKLITTVGGNVTLENVTNNVLKLLHFWHAHVPVAKGAQGPLVRELTTAANVHCESGLAGYEFEGQADECLLEDVAPVAMHKALHASKEPLTIVAIGPLTNVALLLRLYPSDKELIKRIVIMGGTCTRGNKGVLSEFNIATDPEAAKIVFSSGISLAMIGLDIGWKATIPANDILTIKTFGKTGKMVYDLFSHYRSGSINTALKMYDPTAMAYFLKPEFFTVEKTFVDIELAGTLTAGCTLVDFRGYLHGEPNVDVCTDIDVEAFRSWFVEQLSICERKRVEASK